MRILGIDPGLQHTGWGVIEVEGSRLSHLGNGAVHSAARKPVAERLRELMEGLEAVCAMFSPDEAAVEEIFANRNPASTLKLGMARGAVMLAPARSGIPVFEYAANLVKKSVVGTGHADKTQVQAMVGVLLPGALFKSADAADALAVAICHAHHAMTGRNIRDRLTAPGGGASA